MRELVEYCFLLPTAAGVTSICFWHRGGRNVPWRRSFWGVSTGDWYCDCATNEFLMAILRSLSEAFILLEHGFWSTRGCLALVLAISAERNMVIDLRDIVTDNKKIGGVYKTQRNAYARVTRKHASHYVRRERTRLAAYVRMSA